MDKKKSVPSRGWVGFFGLIYVVLLTLFAVALGMTLTIGTPDKLSAELVKPANITIIQRDSDAHLIRTARQAGIIFKPTTTLVTKAALRRFIPGAVRQSADFKATIDTTALVKAVRTTTTQALTTQKVAVRTATKKQVAQQLGAEVDRVINLDLMKGGLGVVYPLVVLTLQTMTIVAGILGVLILGLMRLSAHGFNRWLRITGRITYVIGFLGGILAILGGTPGVVSHLRFGGVSQQLLANVSLAFAPVWQRVAGIVVIVGLLLAALGDLLRTRAQRHAKV